MTRQSEVEKVARKLPSNYDLMDAKELAEHLVDSGVGTAERFYVADWDVDNSDYCPMPPEFTIKPIEWEVEMKYSKFLNLPEKKKPYDNLGRVQWHEGRRHNDLIDQIGSQELDEKAFVERAERVLGKEVTTNKECVMREGVLLTETAKLLAKAIYDALPKLIKGDK